MTAIHQQNERFGFRTFSRHAPTSTTRRNPNQSHKIFGQRDTMGNEATPKMQKFDRITVDPSRMNGEPCIRDLRLTVRRVLEALAIYPDREELKREYPELEDEDIRQALAFAAACWTIESYRCQSTDEALP